MGGMDEAPAGIDRRVIEEPRDGPRARPSQARIDLGGLFGDMDVDRSAGRKRDDRFEFLGSDRAQRVRRDADDGGSERLAVGDKRRVGCEVVDEPALLGLRRRAAKAGVGVEDRKQREGDARLGRRARDALGHLGAVGVGRARGVVVQVVEFGDRAEARLQHFDIGLRRDRLDVVGGGCEREAVHRVAPGPEAVGARAAPLGKARHGALEGVRMQIAERRDADAAALVGRLARRVALDRRDGAASMRILTLEAQPSGMSARSKCSVVMGPVASLRLTRICLYIKTGRKRRGRKRRGGP